MTPVCDVFYIDEDEYVKDLYNGTMHVRKNVPIEEAVPFAWKRTESVFMALQFKEYETAAKAAMRFYMAGMQEPPPVCDEEDGTFSITVYNELGK